MDARLSQKKEGARMSTQIVTANLSNKESTQTNWLKRVGLFLLFFVCEVVIFILGSNYFDIFATNKNLTYNLILSAFFLAAALLFKYTKRFSHYWLVAYAFFMASVAYPSTLLLNVGKVLGRFGLSPNTSQGLAIGKLIEVIVVVVPILVLTKLSGEELGSIFLKRGNLKLGLGIGALVFVNFATSALMFYASRFSRIEMLSDAILWGLIFSLANGFMEELWVRGIFLKRFEPFLGTNGSVWLTALIFASMHSFAYYFMPSAIPFFFMNTLALGLACGYLMMKSDSIWGATLIHIASDFFLFIAVLANA
jgi:membrane protease YdiL (CAAX protease family)